MYSEPLPPDLIGSAKAAKILDVNPSCLHRWVAAGRIRAWRVGGRYRFSEREVRGMIRPVEPLERIRTVAEDIAASEGAMRRLGWLK